MGVGRRVGWGASRLGARVGVDALTYNPVIFEHFHERGLADAPAVVTTMRDVFPHARKWVDVGAGSGVFAAEAQRQGITVEACEHGRNGRRRAQEQGVMCQPLDLNRRPPVSLRLRPFDLAYCFEVAEHLPPELGNRLVGLITGIADVCVFTAAKPGQGGIGHVNEQPAEYWVERFEGDGSRLDEDATRRVAEGFSQAPSGYLGENVLVFR